MREELKRLEKQGVPIQRIGKGVKGDAIRYYSPTEAADLARRRERERRRGPDGRGSTEPNTPQGDGTLHHAIERAGR